MSDKTLFQQFIDTKLNQKIFEKCSNHKIKRFLRVTIICLFISAFAFLSLIQQNRGLINPAFQYYGKEIQGKIIENLSYDCEDLNRLYKGSWDI